MSIVFKKRSIAVCRSDGTPVLTLPGFVVSNPDISYGHFIVFAFYQRDTEELPAVGAGNFTAITPGSLLVMFMSFQNNFTGCDGRTAP